MTEDLIFQLRLEAAEQHVHRASRKLARLKDPMKKCALMWRLAWGSTLRDLEDYRPAGGFAPNKIVSQPQPRENQMSKKTKSKPVKKSAAKKSKPTHRPATEADRQHFALQGEHFTDPEWYKTRKVPIGT